MGTSCRQHAPQPFWQETRSPSPSTLLVTESTTASVSDCTSGSRVLSCVGPDGTVNLVSICQSLLPNRTSIVTNSNGLCAVAVIGPLLPCSSDRCRPSYHRRRS